MNFFGKHNSLFALSLICVLLLWSGCAVGPNYKRPSAPVPQVYKEQLPQGWKQAQPNEGALRGNWWEIYNDAQLNTLEDQVNVNNQNVLQAESVYREARDAARIARSALFPTVGGSFGASRSKTSSNLGNAANRINFIAGTRNDFTLPVDISYQADIWGAVRRNVTANVATAQASAADLENVRLMMHAQLAELYFELRGLDVTQDLLERTVKSFGDYLQLTKDRFSVGVASGSDVAQAQTQLETTRAQLIDINVARAQDEHAIAILIGKPPSGLTLPRQASQVPPPPIPVAVPSALLERRPDIASNERNVAAANEQIGIAKAAFFPTLNLSASGGFESTDISKLLNWSSRFWSLGSNVAETIFDAGKRRAQLDLQRAAYDATVVGYRQTVLTAFQQVEDELAALRVLEQEAAAEENAVKAAQESLDISTAQYKAGTASYLQVLTAQTVALQNERTAVDILSRRLTASVLLVEALGGGWDTSTLPTRKDVLAGGK
jgi:NodT family efflux transporter outer membrane factor (OMF) lipoprotein